MRAWVSVPIIKGVCTGISVNMNPAARVYRVSPIGAKIWYTGSTVMAGRTRDMAFRQHGRWPLERIVVAGDLVRRASLRNFDE